MGALTPSSIPTRPQRELRAVVRYRKTLIQARSAEANRLPKVLEGANVKLGSVLSDLLGKSGQRRLQALARGATDPQTLAALADDRVRATPETLAAALQGLIGGHQQLMLRLQLEHVAFLDRQIEALSDEMGARRTHEEDALTRLETIPGVGRRTAETLVAEVGTERPRVPSAGHRVSWTGFRPGQNERGGKAKPAPTRKGRKALRAAVTAAGRAARRTRTYLGAVYHRRAGRRGAHRAATAVGRHSLLAAYHILTTPGTVYQDLGAHDFAERDRAGRHSPGDPAARSLGSAGGGGTFQTGGQLNSIFQGRFSWLKGWACTRQGECSGFMGKSTRPAAKAGTP